MDKNLERLTIGGLARTAGVNVETVRFYQRRGLLAQPRRAYGRIRHYYATDVRRLRFIKTAQSLGFSLDGIASLLRLEDGTHCHEAQVLAEEKLTDVRNKLADLNRIESALARLVKDCASSDGTIACPLIASLQGR